MTQLGNGREEIRGYPHFQQLRPILVNACALTDDLRRKHEILKDLLVHVRQSPATRSLLFNTGCTCWLAQDPALRHKNNMTVRKFLLQFTGKSKIETLFGANMPVPDCVGPGCKTRRTSPEPYGRPSTVGRARTQRSPFSPHARPPRVPRRSAGGAAQT